MYRWLMRRCWWGLLACLLFTVGGGGPVRAPSWTWTQRQPVSLADWGDWWLDESGRSGLDDASSCPSLPSVPRPSASSIP